MMKTGGGWFRAAGFMILGVFLTGPARAAETPGLSWPDMSSLEPIKEIRRVPDAVWQRRAVAYSGYREGQNPREGSGPSDAEVKQDLELLVDAGFGLIRVYGARGHGEQVIRVIDRHDLDLKVQLGAYVGGTYAENGEANMAELECAIDLANAYPGIIMGVSVGNEILVSWSFVAVPPRQAAGYLRYLRERVPQPVTVNDNWEPYAAAAGSPLMAVWSQIDYASIHSYAYWDAGFEKWPFRQSDGAAQIREAYRYARENFAAVRTALDAAGIEIPIVIGETGWQNLPSARESSATEPDFARLLAGPERQKAYFHAMQVWAYGEDGRTPGDGFSRPAALFYFSAFDEPWKGADDNWGIWDVQRRLKWDPGLNF